MYYILDKHGEAKPAEMMEWANWYIHIPQSDLILARHDIVRKGKVLATVETRLCVQTDLNEKPWVTRVLGTREQTRTGTRAEAQTEHKRMLFWLERMYERQK